MRSLEKCAHALAHAPGPWKQAIAAALLKGRGSLLNIWAAGNGPHGMGAGLRSRDVFSDWPGETALTHLCSKNRLGLPTGLESIQIYNEPHPAVNESYSKAPNPQKHHPEGVLISLISITLRIDQG